MSVYNGERFLRTALDSVLGQTFRDWEVIVIDDASTDSTPEILAEYRDPRIHVLRNEENSKQAVCANRGIAVATGRYIARLDADDISLPNRLTEQVAYLETHSDVTLVASAAYFIDEAGCRVGLQPGGLNDCELKFTFASRNPVIHSTAIFRGEAAKQLNGYDEHPRYWFTEDYEFLSRLALHGKAHVLPQPLVEYRVHSASVSAISHRDQESQSEPITRSVFKIALKREVDDRWWQAWWRFNWTKPGSAVRFESDEVKGLSLVMLGLLRNLKHDRGGRCVVPWYWAKHALALAVLRRGPIPIGARARFLVLALQIAMYKLIWH